MDNLIMTWILRFVCWLLAFGGFIFLSDILIIIGKYIRGSNS